MSALNMHAKKIGWSAHGNLQVGNSSKKVQLQANFGAQDEGQKAGSYTIEFAVDFPKPPLPSIPPLPTLSSVPVHCEALVTWSVEGNFVTRRLSITNGLTITGVGQGVKVVLEDTSLAIPGPGFPGPVIILPNSIEYAVSVQVAPGERGNNALPPVFIPVTGILPGGVFVASGGMIVPAPAVGSSIIVPVPPDSGAISVKVEFQAVDAFMVPVPNTDPGVVVIHSQLTTSGNISLTRYNANFQTDFVPLMPGTSEVVMTNFSLVPGTNYIVQLIFGIDG